MKKLELYRKQIEHLCQLHHVDALYAFGSVIGDGFKPNSDVDLLVRFKSMDIEDYFDNFMDFKFALEALFGKPVDLVEDQAIRNPIFRQAVDQEKQLIYGSKAA